MKCTESAKSQKDNKNLSVQFSRSVVSNSLWPHGLQHARPPCPSPTPRVYSNSCPLSWSSLSITNSQSLLKLMSTESVMPTNHLILCRPLLLLPSIFPSIRVFSNESVLCIRWPKHWKFPSNENSGLTSFRMDWLVLLAVQGTLKSLLTPQFKSINSSVFSVLYSPTLTSIHDYWKKP